MDTLFMQCLTFMDSTDFFEARLMGFFIRRASKIENWSWKCLSKIENLTAAIHNANIEVHQIEARYYELIHAEIYSKYEQHRIDSMLKSIGRLITANQKRALDFGAGTGNITGKLLGMGYEVTAIDISAEMCQILKNKYKPYLNDEKLRIINSPIEDASFDNDRFDCSTVLHYCTYLPDYAYVI